MRTMEIGVITIPYSYSILTEVTDLQAQKKPHSISELYGNIDAGGRTRTDMDPGPAGF